MQQKKLEDFFKTHPHIDTVFIAEGVLFIQLKNAQAFIKDPKSKVETFTRTQIENPPAPAAPTPAAPAPAATPTAEPDKKEDKAAPAPAPADDKKKK